MPCQLLFQPHRLLPSLSNCTVGTPGGRPTVDFLDVNVDAMIVGIFAHIAEAPNFSMVGHCPHDTIDHAGCTAVKATMHKPAVILV